MNKNCLLFTLCLLASVQVSAAIRYWVGPLNGNWSNPAYWAETEAGPGNAGVPRSQDSVLLNADALINIDISPTIHSLLVGRFATSSVRFYTAVPITFTINNILEIYPRSTLKDSTSADVPFHTVINKITDPILLFKGSTIWGNWIFEGGTPVNSGNGPTFTALPGSSVHVTSLYAVMGQGGGRITSKRNAADISSDPSSLFFDYDTYFILDNNPRGAIPYASWSRDEITPRFPFSSSLQFPGATIFVLGNIEGNLRHLASTIAYTRLVIDLPELTADASLALPSGAQIRGNLDIRNTNSHTLTLLAGTGPSGNVLVDVGIYNNGIGFGGYLNISGNNTNVTLARAPDAAPGTSYRLQLYKGFNQSGGNFSLQDADKATGSSTLGLLYDLIQTGGSFITNSTATGPDTKFIVSMDDPPNIPDLNGRVYDKNKVIRMSSGTIDNGRNMVTLRINHSVSFNPAFPKDVNGVTLANPLTVGRLDLFKGPLNTTAANMLTVTDPDAATAVQTGSTATGYVNGPLQRRTNSTGAYVFPTGKGNISADSMFFDSCVVIPASAEPSLYQAEYFGSRYRDTAVTAPFRGVDTSRYWDITKVSGADAQVQLVMNKAVPGATAIDNLVVAHYVNGQWVSEQGTVRSPGNAPSGTVTSKVLSTFSPFTFGYGFFTHAPLPIHLLSFDGHAENGGARLNWKVAEAASRFEVERSANGINFKQVGTVTAQALQQQYVYLDAQLPAGNSFYRLRMVGKDGSFTLSDVIMIAGTGQLTELLTLAPNVVRSTANLRINAVKDGQLQLAVTDMSGRTRKKWVVAVKAGSSGNLLNLADLPAGAYQLTGYLDGRQTPVIRFVKQ